MYNVNHQKASLAVMVTVLLCAANAWGQSLPGQLAPRFQLQGNPELGPGDKGYRHSEMHPFYQKLFDSGRCYCRTGECRPTVYRSDGASPTGIEVKINGAWYDVPTSALQNQSDVPPELWQDPAHVCAYAALEAPGVLVIECVIVNSGV